ncbi:MAG: hypothetical protein KC486_28040 [Myxococcales bacterium]|nr:hypothetical protein [Myxococcales bacterium]
MGLSAALALAVSVWTAAPAGGVPAGALPPGLKTDAAVDACVDPCPGAPENCCDGVAMMALPPAERAAIAAALMRSATDEESATRAAKTYTRAMAEQIMRAIRADKHDELEALAREALERPMPDLVDPKALEIWRGHMRRWVVRAFFRASARVRIDRRSALAAIQGHIERSELLFRGAAWQESADGLAQRAQGELHEALLLALDIRQAWRVCPAILAVESPSYLLEIDALVCRGDPRDRALLKETFARVGVHRRREVDLWRRHLRLRDPLQIAAIATGALSLGAAASAILLDQRYLALCRHTSADAHGCVFEASPQAEAARGASVAFAIAAPALLVTSLALFGQRWRERRARRRGICGAPGFGAGPRAAAVSFSCRF